MKKRKWTSEQKLQIVMQGVKGRAVAEICNEVFRLEKAQINRFRLTTMVMVKLTSPYSVHQMEPGIYSAVS